MSDRKPGHPPMEPGRTRVVRSVSLRSRDEETIGMVKRVLPELGNRSAVIRAALELLRREITRDHG